MGVQQYNTLPVFKADQVLTAEDLNALVNYLEEQELLTRAKLIGSGIVCGLEISLVEEGAAIAITKGVGVTSKGHLIAFSGRDNADVEIFRFYEPYPFEEHSAYSFFYDNGNPITVYQMHPLRVGDSEALSEIPNGISNYGVLLYLECYEQDNKQCSTNDCDDKGATRNYNIIPLLVSLEDMRRIICMEESLDVPKSQEEIDELFNGRYRVRPLSLERFRPGNLLLTNYMEFYNYYERIINNSMFNIQMTLVRSFDFFRPVLRELYGNTGASFRNSVMQRLPQILEDLRANSPFAVQYFHDLLCDLVEAYQEFREAAFDLMMECCPGLGRFPKHLRLGHLAPIEDCVPSPYRMSFTYSPILNEQGALRTRILGLHQKIHLLIENFVDPLQFREVRITPSVELDRPLSHKSIPYYYNINTNFLRRWNPELRRRCRERENLSYHANLYAENLIYSRNPLRFSLKQKDFFRIEGHLGQDYRVALRNILNIRDGQNLPFDVVALKVGRTAGSTSIEGMECHFQDLEVICNAWKEELACRLRGLVQDLGRINITNTIQGNTGNTGGGNINTGGGFTINTNLTNLTLGNQIDYGDIVNIRPELLDFYLARSGRLNLNVNVGNTVYRAFPQDEDTLGRYVLQGIDNAQGGANDFAAYAVNELKNRDDVAALPTKDFQLAFEFPARIMAFAYDYARKVDNTCENLEIEQIEQVQQRLVQLMRQYLIFLTQYNPDNDEWQVLVDKFFTIQLVNMFLSVCSLEQLKIIKGELERRKAELRRMNLFHEYLRKNPGMDHAAGVPKGGTFVIIYHEQDTIDVDDDADFYTVSGVVTDVSGNVIPGASIWLRGTTRGTFTDASGRFVLEVPAGIGTLEIYVIGYERIVRTVSGAISNMIIVLGGESEGDTLEAPPNRAVIGDFFLPYNCCSDCPSIDYVLMPAPTDDPVSLNLDPTIFCVPTNQDDPTVPFTVEPAGGEVTGEGVTGDVENGYFFNPDAVSLGEAPRKQLTFQVNGQDVPLIVTVERKPTASFEVEVEWEIGPAAPVLIIELQNFSSENATAFEWTVIRVTENGEEEEILNLETENRDLDPQLIEANPGDTLTVTLVARTQNCEDTDGPSTLTVPEIPENIDFRLVDIQGFAYDPPIINNITDNPFFLFISPGNGELEENEFFEILEMELVEQNDEFTQYQFFSNGREPGDYTLLYVTENGNSAEFTITIVSEDGLDGGSAGEKFRGDIGKTRNSLLQLSLQPTFGTTLKGTDGYELMVEVTNGFLTNTASVREMEKLKSGAGNESFADLMEKATEDTSSRLIEIGGQGTFDIANSEGAMLLSLYHLQVSSILSMISLQNKDLNAQDAISKMLTVVGKQIDKMKENGVDVNPKNSLVKSIKQAGSDLSNKPKITKKLNDLIKKIKD